MRGGGWTRAYPVLQNSTMPKQVLITFFFTANPLALFWWYFYFPIQKTEPSAQHDEFPLTMAGRQTFEGLAGVVTWASTPVSAQATIVPCHTCCVCTAPWRGPLACWQHLSALTKSSEMSTSHSSTEKHKHWVLLLTACSLPALFLCHPMFLLQRNVPELLQRPMCCHHVLVYNYPVL